MNNFSESCEVILKTLKTIEPNINFLNQIRIAKLADIELIAVSITPEYLSIDSEYQLFRKLSKILANKIERSVYNRRRRKLFPFIELIRQKMAGLLIPYEDYFIVDSKPLEICKLSRRSRVKVFSKQLQIKGFVPHKKCTFWGINYMRFVL